MIFLYGLNEQTWKRWGTLADQCRRRLTEQQISPGDPGTILKDVNMLLEFVGSGGLPPRAGTPACPANGSRSSMRNQVIQSSWF